MSDFLFFLKAKLQPVFLGSSQYQIDSDDGSLTDMLGMIPHTESGSELGKHDLRFPLQLAQY